jgi:hypothetical protein
MASMNYFLNEQSSLALTHWTQIRGGGQQHIFKIIKNWVFFQTKWTKNSKERHLKCESDCVNNSCSNGSTCIDGDNSYTCACPLTHTGKYWYIYDHIFEDNANQHNLEMWQVLLPWLLKSWLVHIFCVFLWNTQLLPFTALYSIQHYVIKFVTPLSTIFQLYCQSLRNCIWVWWS